MSVLFHSCSNLDSHKSKCIQVLEMKGNHQGEKLKSVQTIASFTQSNQRYQVLHNQSKHDKCYRNNSNMEDYRRS